MSEGFKSFQTFREGLEFVARVQKGTRTIYKPPKCPACGVELWTVAEDHYETYKFDAMTGRYRSDGEAEIKCIECGVDLFDVFPDGVCNYKAFEREVK
jgi:hypothetical protein